ncbi:MAG TPA: protein kinase [Candidatus Acidoferrales bacterium]|nr:protein kinase [Candidatus Acidoferrales bacterium]
MTSERLQQIEALYQLVRGQSAAERTALLAHIDPDLRREVESLLAQDAGDEFRDPPIPPFLDNSTLTILGVGASLGPYRIENMLGEGGMGQVYRAVDTRLGRAVAIKTTREQFTSRFGREARTISSLNHPNICTLYDVGPNYLVMELVEGETIAARLKNGPLPLNLALLYASQIVSALAEAHEKGIIHRDLKPGNIMIAKSGVKVLDFGLAKSQQDHTLTASHMVMGTPAYMAPEQREGRADARSDIYSFGCVLYEMLTGTRVTFERKGIPSPQLERIISRCLEEDPTQRWASAAGLGRELELAAAVTGQGRGEATVLARQPWVMLGAGLGLLLLLAIGGYKWLHEERALPPVASQADWVQLTDFADSAVSPALSPDGHILTFIRGGYTFYGKGEIYAKVLPNGEPVQLTHDGAMKMSPQFSPDGSNIAYTTLEWSAAQDEWQTWVIPALGGEPRLMLPNAEGLTWIDGGHLLFSEIKSGLHMTLVTATDTRDQIRDVYVPPGDRGMAHRSALSPDHKWVLVAEMDNGGWLPCRLVPFDGSTTGKPIGPPGARCTYVAWSPDQTWMYVSSDAGGRFHIWRQRFPDGQPEQVTSGVTEEEGIAVAPDGRSLITSVGLQQSTLWVRDSKGERQVSSEGYAAYPQSSPDGKRLYYLALRESTFDQLNVSLLSGELWVADLETGQSQRLLPNFLVTGYSISHDGTEVVFSAKEKENRQHLWLASLALRFPPREFSSPANEDQPHWDAQGRIYFRAAEGNSNYLYRMNADGSNRVKALPDPILEFHDVSPDGRWALVDRTLGQESPLFASSLDDGGSVTICPGLCLAQWTSDGGSFSVTLGLPMGGEDTLVVPVSRSNSLPTLPSGGLQTRADMTSVPGAKILDGFITPGPKVGIFALLRRDVHRNLYRIPIQ